MRRRNIFLYPVITRVPTSVEALGGREKLIALSRLARKSAGVSASKSECSMIDFEKNELGIPLPANGIYWSVSHKPDVVAGVVSKKPVGIDVEQVKDVSTALFKKILDPDERRCFKNQEKQVTFFRAFTAKEAVLKETTAGLKGLSKTKIVEVMDDRNLVVEYKDRKYWVENFYFEGYLASVTKDCFDVQWTVG